MVELTLEVIQGAVNLGNVALGQSIPPLVFV